MPCSKRSCSSFRRSAGCFFSMRATISSGRSGATPSPSQCAVSQSRMICLSKLAAPHESARNVVLKAGTVGGVPAGVVADTLRKLYDVELVTFADADNHGAALAGGNDLVLVAAFDDGDGAFNAGAEATGVG